MIKLTRSRDVAHLKGYTGADLELRLKNLLTFFYDGSGVVDFKQKSRQIWGKAKAQLRIETHGKCAYCEADTSVVAHGDVEHFRPKDTYWWLAYSVDNYTFSCQICNQSYKGVKFPISGKRLTRPRLPKARPTLESKFISLAKTLSPDPATITDKQISALLSVENAHLINPYVEDPEKLFAWRVYRTLKEVRLVPNKKLRSAQAVKAAEEVLGLNREELLRLRWVTYSTLETLVLTFQEPSISKAAAKRIYKQLTELAKDDHQFAGMNRYFLKKWRVL
jgi:hypothetical protein